MMEDERQSVEAHSITISYGFFVDGEEYIAVSTGEEDMSRVFLLGILELAKSWVLEPDDEEEFED